MRGKAPSFPFYPDAWLSSTDISLMTPAEEGGFIRLLCHAWLQSDCGLPDDDQTLAKLSRLNRTWNRVSGRKLRAKFRVENGRLYNDRLLEEWRKRLEWKEKSRLGGKKSAAARGKGGSSVVDDCSQPNANSSLSSSISKEPTPTPSVNSERKLGRPHPPSSGNEQDYHKAEFHRLAEEYPGHVDLDFALQTWMSLIDSGDLTAEQIPEVFAGLERWRDSAEWAQDDGKFIPRLSSWLNGSKGRRWRDKPKPRETAEEPEDWRPEWENPDGSVKPEFADARPFSREEVAEVERRVTGGAA